MKKILSAFLFFISVYGFATHNRAGEILYKRIAPFTEVVGGNVVQVYTYSFTVIIYTDTGPNIADRCEDTLYFGDGTHLVIPRVNSGAGNCQCANCGEIILQIGNPPYVVKKNIYTAIHRYPGPGNYKVYTYDPNRNEGVINIKQSVNQPFYIESLLIINSFTGANSSPTFSFDPIDRACANRCFYHNPGAYDVDNDSLSYELTTSRGADGKTVTGWSEPPVTGGCCYSINPVDGTLTWCSPPFVGQYNLAFVVKEWRKNTSGKYELVGYVLRDMQVIALSCTNNPPLVTFPPDTCVEAGALIQKKFVVTDPDPGGATVRLSTGGGAFSAVSPAASLSPLLGNTTFTADFTWQTTCDHIRQQPYYSVVKAEDQTAPVKLVFFGSYGIRVVPPSVKNVSVTPIGSNMRVTWDLSVCNPANNPIVAYRIYRKNDCNPVTFDPCKSGVDPSLGYEFIGQSAATATLFTDNNNGNGLVVGQDYNYLVVAQYADGSQSFASTQICAKLKRDIPILLNVDILSTSTSSGSVFTRWSRPLKTNGNLDTLALPGPYTFNLKYRPAGTTVYTTVFTSTANFLYQLDTSFTHLSVNTETESPEYSVEFLATGTTVVGSSQKASSVFLTATAGDRKIDLQWVSATPWKNYKYTVYRRDPSPGSTFTAIATTTATLYSDNNKIANRFNYCYYVKSEGAYSDPSIFKPLENKSQQVCATAVDLTPPCSPTISIVSDCPTGFVSVEWNNVRKLPCGDDVVKYILYKKATVNDEYAVLAEITDTSTFRYTFDGLDLISSCFAIQAVDSSNNLSGMSPDYCVDNCPEFELPNIITINGDGMNDFFKAMKVRHIKEINLLLFDRWGNLVYKTTDPYFKWDGVSIISKQVVSDGVFFYLCDVFEPRVTGITKRMLKGNLTVVK